MIRGFVGTVVPEEAFKYANDDFWRQRLKAGRCVVVVRDLKLGERDGRQVHFEDIGELKRPQRLSLTSTYYVVIDIETDNGRLGGGVFRFQRKTSK